MMCRPRSILFGVCALSFIWAFNPARPGTVAQESKATQSRAAAQARHTEQLQRHPIPTPATGDQMMNVPYFTLRDGMNSVLTLNNNMQTPMTVNVTIFNSAGKAHALSPITLPRNTIKTINLADVVPSHEFDDGNIELGYAGQMMAVTCQVSISSTRGRIGFESREQDMMDFKSTNLNGVAWIPNNQADAYLALTNIAPYKIASDITIGTKRQQLSLFPRETQLVRISDSSGGRAAEGVLIKLKHDGKPGDIITTGFVVNARNGYSSGFAMTDPSLSGSTHLAGAHFRVGKPAPSDGFPEGTRFHSPLVLANAGHESVTVHVSVDYTIEGDSTTSEATPDVKKQGRKRAFVSDSSAVQISRS